MYTYKPAGDEVVRVDAHAFVKRFMGHVKAAIPKQLAAELGLKEGDLVEIIVRKVDEEYVKKTYGYVPPLSGKAIICPEIHMKCPLCGKEGTVKGRLISKKSPYISVRHYDGTLHYIPILLYKDFVVEAVKALIVCKERRKDPAVEYWRKIYEVLVKQP